MSNRAACSIALIDAQRSRSTEFLKVYARNAINDCTTALESSWASSSLPQSILNKLRFRLDKATASYDELNVFHAHSTVVNESISNIEVQRDDAETIVQITSKVVSLEPKSTLLVILLSMMH